MDQPKLSEAQQSLMDKITAGAALRFMSDTGRYRLQHEGRERTVFPNTVQSLLNAGLLEIGIGGACFLPRPTDAARTVDGTPPPDFPEQVIIMDRAFAQRHPTNGFYLRLAPPGGHVNTIRLDNEVTPVGARRSAQALGYPPTHWMEVGDGLLCKF